VWAFEQCNGSEVGALLSIDRAQILKINNNKIK